MIALKTNSGVRFKVRVIPRSSKAGITGELEGSLRVKLTSPPVNGAANAELIKLFAKHFDVPKSSVRIVSGETAKTKSVEIDGLDFGRATAILYEFS